MISNVRHYQDDWDSNEFCSYHMGKFLWGVLGDSKSKSQDDEEVQGGSARLSLHHLERCAHI
jgi:hypothetical protein